MKPIKLSMSAFGPYKETETIDFLELQDHHLFLITGPTGAGKTSIFDAICYALYGETSGSDRPEKSIRCQNASPNVLTEVEFTFELKGKPYTVYRRPKQERPKKSGDGLTEAPGEANLYMPREDRPITGLTGVTGRITDLVGLELNQFRQIMMIPQGEFRKLLVAKSDERTEILKRIFKTHLYGDLQRKFKEKSRELEKKIEQKVLQRKNELLTLDYDPKETFGEDLELELQKEHLNIERIIEIVKRSQHGDTEALINLTKMKEQEDNEQQKLYEQRQSAVDNNQKLTALEELEKDLKLLEDQKETFEKKEEEYKNIQQAEKIAPKQKYYQDRKKEVEEKHQGLDRERTAFETLLKELQSLDQEKEEVTSEIFMGELEALKKETSKLEEYREVLRDVKDISKEYEEAEKLRKQAEDQHRKLQEELAAAKAALAATQKVMEENREAAKSLYENEIKRSELKQLIALLKKAGKSLENLEALQEEEKMHETAYHQAEEAWEKADQHWKEKRRRYHLNQAANLAKELKDDEPCPVCGSADHPSPATFTEAPCTIEEVDQAEELVTRAAKDKSSAQMNLETARTRKLNAKETVDTHYRELEEILPEDVKITKNPAAITKLTAEQEAKASSLNQKIIQLIKDKETFEQAEKKKAELDEAFEKLTEKEGQGKEKVQYHENAAKLLETKRDTMLKNIPVELTDEQALESRKLQVSSEMNRKEARKDRILEEYQKKHDERTKISASIATAEKALKGMEERLDQEKAFYHKALEEEGMTEEAFLYFQQKIPEKNGMEKELTDYHDALKNKKAAIAQQRSGIKDFEKAELEDMNLKIEGSKERLSKLLEDIDTVRQRKGSNHRILENVHGLNKDMEKEEKDFKTLGHIANVISGNNEMKLPFERFILRSYLRDVLTAANQRFTSMTNGRYTLKLADGIEDRRASSGLDLEVFDRYTGLPRSVKTLSGGESFKASLSMALGLAEVVQSHAGGIMLDTVFIDEGFGTLDQESLDNAINCLIDLQDAGRLVGIISHVEELKERIQAQLIVQGDETGSRTVFRLP